MKIEIIALFVCLFVFYQSNMTLAAVALQDHMSRSLSLQDPFRKKKVNHSLPVTKRTNDRVQQNARKKGKPGKADNDKQEYNLDPKPAPFTLGLMLLFSLTACLKVWTKMNLYATHIIETPVPQPEGIIIVGE